MAHALDVVGERWTLLIVRDLMFGPLRFGALRDGLPGLVPNLLSDRLRFLVDAGVVEQAPAEPPATHAVYRLTERGRELSPVVHELSRFGIADWDDPDADPPPPHLVRGALLSLMAPERLGRAGFAALVRLPTAQVAVLVDPASAHDDRHPLDRLRLRDLDRGTDAAPSTDVEVTASLGTLLALRRGTCTAAEAEDQGRLALHGPRPARERLARLLGWP